MSAGFCCEKNKIEIIITRSHDVLFWSHSNSLKQLVLKSQKNFGVFFPFIMEQLRYIKGSKINPMA